MHDGLLPIGTFARAALLPVGTLRHYHETGLLEPVNVDADSGYRYYSSAQLVDAEIIRRLRALDVGLDDIRRILRARDDEVTKSVLAAHHTEMASRLAETQRIVDELQQVASAPLRLLASRVKERQVPDATILAYDGVTTEEGLSAFAGEAYGALWAIMQRDGLAMAGPPGAVYPGEDWDAGRIEVTAFVPVAAGDHPDVRPLPGGRFAVTSYQGPYEQIGDAYRGIGAWMAGHHLQGVSEVREHYLVGPTDVDDPARYVTEIHWPLS